MVTFTPTGPCWTSGSTRIVMMTRALPVAGVEEPAPAGRCSRLDTSRRAELTKFVVMPERTARAWVDVDKRSWPAGEPVAHGPAPVDLDDLGSHPPVVGQHYSNGELD